MESPFTSVDYSIDILGAVFFSAVIFWSVAYMWENHLTVQGRIIYCFMIGISALQIFQVVMQVVTGGFAPFRVWDFVNYTTAVLFLMLVHRLAKRESNLKKHKD